MQYWEGSTGLGPRCKEGAELQVLLFWRADGDGNSLGFCSSALGACKYYQDVSGAWASDEMAIQQGASLRTAFQTFEAHAFGQLQPRLQGFEILNAVPESRAYTTVLTTITLPRLDPPEAVRLRKARPGDDVQALVRKSGLNPVPGMEACRLRMLIPFYGDHDMSVPVCREGTRGCGALAKPAVLLPQWTEHGWWLGTTNHTESPDHVRHYREKIERALMLDTGWQPLTQAR